MNPFANPMTKDLPALARSAHLPVKCVFHEYLSRQSQKIEVEDSDDLHRHLNRAVLGGVEQAARLSF